jgi:hypothetical protein
MKAILCLALLPLIFSFAPDNRKEFFPKKTEVVKKIPSKKEVWVFLLAGQSNMAGRGKVEPQDTVPNERVLTINSKGQLILAKEPIHFQEPGNEGLDCGLSFGKEMVKNIPKNIKILILPTAIGGSSISQWIGDSLFRKVHLLSNFNEKAELGKKYGTIKGVLWHQGEADATPKNIPLYKDRLAILFTDFRSTAGNSNLPVILGELGPFPYSYENWMKINAVMKEYCQQDKNSALISTSDLKHKGDSVHFNSEGQRLMGQRYAHTFLSKFK